MRIIRYLLPLFAVCMIAASCSDDSTQPQSDMGRLRLSMTDAPAKYEKVIVTFSEISVQSDGGWFVVRNNPITIDLMEWNNGKSVVLCETGIPAGRYTHIRLVMTQIHIVVNGKIIVLDPSNDDDEDDDDDEYKHGSRGIKLVHAFQVTPGGLCDMVIDFDLASSFIVTGPRWEAKSYKLKPKLRVIWISLTGRASGSISGTVANPEENPIATVKDSTGVVVAAAIVDPFSGEWKVAFLTAGTYTVKITDDLTRSYTQTDVRVRSGAETKLGPVMLQ